jgi:hypothetical protein
MVGACAEDDRAAFATNFAQTRLKLAAADNVIFKGFFAKSSSSMTPRAKPDWQSFGAGRQSVL